MISSDLLCTSSDDVSNIKHAVCKKNTDHISTQIYRHIIWPTRVRIMRMRGSWYEYRQRQKSEERECGPERTSGCGTILSILKSIPGIPNPLIVIPWFVDCVSVCQAFSVYVMCYFVDSKFGSGQCGGIGKAGEVCVCVSNMITFCGDLAQMT